MWISQLNLDLVDCTLTCVTTANPDAPDQAFRVEFKEVGKVSVERYHDARQVSLGDFGRFRMRPTNGDGRAVFEINTGDALLTFEASADPSIVPITVHPTPSEVFERSRGGMSA
jgi:hypothetical protein